MKIFLGGTCNGSLWRQKLIPLLQDNNIDYFDPVVADWTPQCQKEEIRQRTLCDYVLYVITPKMTGVYSIAQLIDDSNKQPQKTIFIIIKRDGRDQFTESQLKSLGMVAKMVQKNGGKYCQTFQHLVQVIRND